MTPGMPPKMENPRAEDVMEQVGIWEWDCHPHDILSRTIANSNRHDGWLLTATTTGVAATDVAATSSCLAAKQQHQPPA